MIARLIARLLFIAITFSCNLCFGWDCYIFNTGDANFSVLKSQDKALIVDCGAQEPARFVDEYVVGKIKKVLDGITEIKVFVTHNHKDHYNLIERLFKEDVVPTKRSVMIASPSPGSKESVYVYVRNSFEERDKVEQFLSDCLPGVDVQAFLCKAKLTTDPIGGVHDHNILLKIGGRLLFTGDADGHLLTRLLSQQEEHLDDFLRGVQCTVLPHHGSNKNVEQMWFFRTKSPVNIICAAIPGQWYSKEEYEDAISARPGRFCLLTGDLGDAGYYHISFTEALNFYKCKKGKEEEPFLPGAAGKTDGGSSPSSSSSGSSIIPEKEGLSHSSSLSSLCSCGREEQLFGS